MMEFIKSNKSNQRQIYWENKFPDCRDLETFPKPGAVQIDSLWMIFL